MPTWIRGPELIVILIIVILLFGPGRLGRVAGELGRSIREFRSGLKERIEDEGEAAPASGEEPKAD